MKKKLSTALAVVALIQTAAAQSWQNAGGFMAGPSVNSRSSPRSSELMRSELLQTPPRDPCREINTTKFFAKGPGWFILSGRVSFVHTKGIVVENIGSSTVTSYFVSNFPDKLAEGEQVKGLTYTARESGTIKIDDQYGSHTLRHYEYGKPCAAPEPVKLTPEQIAAQKELKEKQRQASKVSAVKYNQAQADKGDDDGQLRMGERYRDGDGVALDLVMARKYFTLSAAQGNTTAVAALAKLNAPKL